MKTENILNEYLTFFKEKGHKEIPNMSLVPEGDSTLLFVNSGMFPLVPYLLGETHPLGKRLVNVQRSIRFEDIDEIGDSRHTLAFHMLGNWSLDDYFREEQLNWYYEFLIEKLNIDPSKLYSSVFEGDESAPRDEESIKVLQDIYSRYGIEAEIEKRIFPYGKKSNWWQRGDALNELGGPDSETFYYLGEGTPVSDPESDEENFLEIGNSVFMKYKKTQDGWEEISKRNIDFGGGLERLALVLQGKKDIYETDNFWPVLEELQKITGKSYHENTSVKRSMRIISDHMRSCVFLAMDGVVPGNKDQGYALRRLIRRMVRHVRVLGLENGVSSHLTRKVCEMFSWLYPELPSKSSEIEKIFLTEEHKFRTTLQKGEREMAKVVSKLDTSDIKNIAKAAFDLYQSIGYPSEIFIEDLLDRNIIFDKATFELAYDKLSSEHQEKSREGASQKFTGGLADQSEQVVKYHTVTHLLQEALRKVLGEHVRQVGSNITGSRLRFDFTHSEKLTPEEVTEVTHLVNNSISEKLPVNFEILPRDQAESSGALFLENEAYPDQVKVYFIGNDISSAYSMEFCGGPHVKNTSELMPIEIFKQDKIGKGKIRIYARFVES